MNAAALAAEWMRQGHALEAQATTAEALTAALRCYDQAVAALRAVPLGPDPRLRRDLGVAWMNRGNILLTLATPATLIDAVQAYDEAIALLETLPFASPPDWRNSLAAAWMNRGHALHRQGTAASLAAALASHARAVALFQTLPLEAHPSFRYNLAGASLNHANALLDTGDFPAARASAHRALELVAPTERDDPAAADLALKLRRTLCDSLGQLLVAPDADRAAQNALACEASDLVDDALALVRHWETRGLDAFRPLATRLLRFGAQLYGTHQPHFLAEFLLENLDSAASPGAFVDPERHAIATAAIAAVLSAAPADDTLLVRWDDPDTQRRLQTRAALRQAADRLAVLPGREPPI